MNKRAIHGYTGSSTVNYTNFGKAIKTIAQSALLDILEHADHGWSDGGCYTFANAVHNWIEQTHPGVSKMVSVKSPNKKNQTDHVLCRLSTPNGFLYIDAEGCGSKDEVLARWNATEHQYWEPPCEMANKLLDVSGISPVYPEMSELVTKRFKAVLGDFDITLLGDIPERLKAQGLKPRKFKIRTPLALNFNQ